MYWIIKLWNYDFEAKYRPDLKNRMADFLSWYFIRKEVNQIEITPAYIGVILYNKKGVWKSVKLLKKIYKLLQVVFSSIEEYDESSKAAVLREVREKIGLVEMQLKYLINDPKYDCNIYIIDIERVISERTESKKISL